MHSVWAYNQENHWAVLITVYRPDPKHWINWRTRRPKDATIYAVNGYDAVMLLATIIGRVGADPEKVKPALYELSGYIGAGGELRFDSNGDAIRNVKLYVVRKGKFKSL